MRADLGRLDAEILQIGPFLADMPGAFHVTGAIMSVLRLARLSGR